MKDLFGDMIERACELLQLHQPKDGPYYGCFSGGKDSVVIKRLADIADINVVWYYHPTIDPPELVRFIRTHHQDVIWTKSKTPFFQAVKNNGMPGPWFRFCCSLSKERHGRDQRKILGVRAAESPRRARTWTEAEEHAVAPILHWSDADVWDFIRAEKLPYCSLYDEEFDRLGCIGCPLASQGFREKQFARWPRYERAWMRSLRLFWEAKVDDAEFLERQKLLGFDGWEDHWGAWRGDMREYCRAHKKENQGPLCGETELIRFQQ